MVKTTATVNEVSSPNSHVREYLRHYFSFQHSPGYAVLLNGPWGIGKTFLIKKLLDEHFKEQKEEYIYMSLYGLTSIEEINEALLAAIYPAIECKGVKIAGRVVKAALSYGAIETDFKLGDFLGQYNAKLFVFDDLERCELKPINKVLGYINEFIEHDGCKVLIIANEEEIEDGAEYRRRREKLVGKTLEVQSSFDEAIAYFISTIDDADTKRFVQEKAADISATYYQSKLHNLRILQQTIWDFERVYRVLSAKHRANDNAMTILLKMFFALSFELKAGRITEEALGTRMGGMVSAMA
ncbi:MAG: P-loop NTPase fold protein, partial [Arenimonas sp.]